MKVDISVEAVNTEESQDLTLEFAVAPMVGDQLYWETLEGDIWEVEVIARTLFARDGVHPAFVHVSVKEI